MPSCSCLHGAPAAFLFSQTDQPLGVIAPAAACKTAVFLGRRVGQIPGSWRSIARRDFPHNVLDVQSLDHLLELGAEDRDHFSAIAFAERNRLADHFEISAADAAVLRGLRFCSALWTVHAG
jgi:hypothetical protein